MRLDRAFNVLGMTAAALMLAAPHTPTSKPISNELRN
jgi:hypothetical protein